jgi:hypothetical protein
MSTPDDASVHLRAAALELIAAARAMLDLTEELVKDPAPMLSAVTAMAAVARQAAAQAGSPPSASSSSSASDDSGERAEGATGPDTGDTRPGTRRKPRVQHIRVS